jgi:hypothetical protein
LFKKTIELPLVEKLVLNKTKYGRDTDKATVDGYVAPDMMVHLLKRQLIE